MADGRGSCIFCGEPCRSLKSIRLELRAVPLTMTFVGGQDVVNDSVRLKATNDYIISLSYELDSECVWCAFRFEHARQRPDLVRRDAL